MKELRELTVLEGWILEVAAKASENGKKTKAFGMPLPPAVITRRELVAILKPANTDERAGLSWGSDKERELTEALYFLLRGEMLVNLGVTDQDRDGRLGATLSELSRRIAKLEGFPEQGKKEVNAYGAFGIAGLGWVKLREMDSTKQQGLAGA
jgi:hypothetical protein